MNSLISICIPTCQRPRLLREAIISALNQTYLNIEIVVSDDSSDDISEEMIKSIDHRNKIRYFRNQPALKQARNVNQLFDLAQGDRLVLLHDDDLLLPDAVQQLADSWIEYPHLVACYGKQDIITMSGEILLEASKKLNQEYYRTSDYAGYQSSALWAGIVAQIPNDGYMIKTSIARQVRYRDIPEVGDVCDYDFGLRLAIQAGEFFFLDQTTSQYRLTEQAISINNNHANLTYGLVKALILPTTLEAIRHQRLQKYASPAINRYLVLGDKEQAQHIYYSQYYSWKKRLSPVGCLQFLLLSIPAKISTSLAHQARLFKQKKYRF